MKFGAAMAVLFLLDAPTVAATMPIDGLPGATLTQKADRIVLRWPGRGAVPLSWDGPCRGCRLLGADRVPDGPAHAVALRLTHASRPGNPTAQCGAGEEVMLHLIALQPRPREAATLRLASCWLSIDPAAPPVWHGNRLHAERQRMSSAAALERFAWQVGPAGGVTPLAPR